MVFGEVAAAGGLPFDVGLDQVRAGQRRGGASRLGTRDNIARHLISMFSRSSFR